MLSYNDSNLYFSGSNLDFGQKSKLIGKSWGALTETARVNVGIEAGVHLERNSAEFLTGLARVRRKHYAYRMVNYWVRIIDHCTLYSFSPLEI